MSNTEVVIEHVQDWLSQHDEVHVESQGTLQILTANRHGDLHVGDPDRPLTVNINDPDVTVIGNDD